MKWNKKEKVFAIVFIKTFFSSFHYAKRRSKSGGRTRTLNWFNFKWTPENFYWQILFNFKCVLKSADDSRKGKSEKLGREFHDTKFDFKEKLTKLFTEHVGDNWQVSEVSKRFQRWGRNVWYILKTVDLTYCTENCWR